jgi:hypothetical protein
MGLKPDSIIAGWTAAQWITVLKTVGVPAMKSHEAAMKFRVEYLVTHDVPAPYDGSGIETELLEVAIILNWAK